METVKGLQYVDEYLTDKDEKNLIQSLKDKEWIIEDKRKSLHYSYHNHNIPLILKELVDKISEKFGKKFDQIIVTQNPKGHGISSHIDNTKLFDDIIVMLIINDNCTMKFEKDNENVTVSVKKNGMISIQGDARYNWKHAILSYKKGFINTDKTWINITLRSTKNNI